MTSLALVLAYAPVIRHEFVAPSPLAGERWFSALHPVFAPLRQACAEDPGVVLADTNAGHYIRYFTECSVIANNFLLTEQQFEKAAEVDRLFSLPPEQLTQQAPFVKYVLARAGDIRLDANGVPEHAFYGRQPAGLSKTLLLTPATSVSPEFKLLYEVTMRMHPANSQRAQDVAYAKLYKILPPAAAPASAVNNGNEAR
jgi:hypothetical protein